MLLSGYPVVRVVLAARGDGHRLPSTLMDDAYYYLRIAENLAQGRGSTFGLLEHTNGYHPLWQFLLVPVAAVFSGNALLIAMATIQALLFCGFLLSCLAIARRLQVPGGLAVGAFAYATFVGLWVGGLFFTGMENALVLLFLAQLVLQTLRLLADPARPNVRGGLVFGLLATGLALSRIDAVLFPVVVVILLIAVRSRGGKPWRAEAAAALGVPLAALAAYGLLNLVIFGTAVPTSGEAKAIGGGSFGLTTFREWLLVGGYGRIPLVAGAQAVVLVGLALALLRRQARRSTAPPDDGLTSVLVAMSVAQLGQLAYYQLTSSWMLWPWYHYYLPMLLFLGGLVVLRTVVAAGLPRGLVTGAGVLLVLVLAGLDLRSVQNAPNGAAWYTNAATTGEWLEAHAEPGATVAIGDRAGRFGWAYRGPILQLEGLVQGQQFLPYLREGRVTDAMTGQRVSYYVRSEGGPDANSQSQPGPTPLPGQPGCALYVEPLQGSAPKSSVVACASDLVYRVQGTDGSTWSVWRYRADRQR